MSSGGQASVRPLELPLGTPGDEAIAGTRGEDAPVEEKNLLERMLEAENLRRARHQVRRNQGARGVDGMTVDDLGEYVKTHWPMIRAALLEGTYAPQPVRRTAIPKPGGGTRHLGIPTGLERNGTRRSPIGATAFAHSAVPTRRWGRRRRTPGKAIRGW